MLADRQGGVAADRFAGREQQRLRPGDLDLLGVGAALHGVAHGDDRAAIARAGRLVPCDGSKLTPPGGSSGRAISTAPAPVSGVIDSGRRRIHRLGDGERRSVGKDAARRQDGDLARRRAATGRASASGSRRSAAARPASAPRATVSKKRSCCWKCCVRRNRPSDHSTRFASLMPPLSVWTSPRPGSGGNAAAAQRHIDGQL